MEEERVTLREKAASFDILQKQYHESMTKFEELTKEVRKLRSQKKDMSKSFYKELSAHKVQATM